MTSDAEPESSSSSSRLLGRFLAVLALGLLATMLALFIPEARRKAVHGNETMEHPTWGRIANRQGDQWELEEVADWPSVGSIKVRFYINDPDDAQTRTNYLAIKSKWVEIWSRILRRTEEMRASYRCQDEPIDPSSDYFYVRVPVIAIDKGASWSTSSKVFLAGSWTSRVGGTLVGRVFSSRSTPKRIGRPVAIGTLK